MSKRKREKKKHRHTWYMTGFAMYECIRCLRCGKVKWENY